MTCDEFKGIIDKIPKLKSVAINGIGEPLLCPDFIPIINLLEKRKINFSFYTNAMLLNEKMQEILCNKKYFSNIGVSCDSSKKEIYELIRKGANFEIFVKNVKSFLRKIESKKLNIVANMNCVLTKRNIAHADEIIVFASDLGFKQISFTEMINNNPQCDDISVTNGIKSSMKAVDLIALGKEKEISVNFTFKNKSKDIICFAPWEVLYIDYTGQIFPCCTIIDRELVPNLGNLKMKTLQDIWNSFEYQKLRDDFIRAESSFCNKCYFYHG